MSSLPNILTSLRLVAAPVMVVFYVLDDGAQGPFRWLALIVFVGAAATDLLDGYLARRWGAVSTFGKLADPIADKVLVLTALAMLAAFEELPWWPFIVLLVREVAVTLGRLAVASDNVISASAGGKVKTVLQVIAIAAMLLPVTSPWVDVAAWWVLMVAIAIAMLTGIDYGIRIARSRSARRAGTDAAGTQAERESA